MIDYSLMPSQQYVCYIMAKTSYILMRWWWWWPLGTIPTSWI